MKAGNVSRSEMAGMIDHAFLRPEATRQDLRAACELVKSYKVGCLCVRPCDVAEAAGLLKAAGVKVATAIGFPHGSTVTTIKAAEAARAVADGADELDMAVNIGRLIGGDTGFVRADIAGVVEAAAGRTVKVILECCYLDRDQMAAGCDAAIAAGARFVKTSTGLGPSGAKVEDVRFLRWRVGEALGVKAAGGIRTLADALAMIEAGANRIGTSSTAGILDALPT
ncbi:MAG: deoxyribose-phosphate aldolase [Planctomycetota bacterium]|jgi:deoxyribose-phosphate aldolase